MTSIRDVLAAMPEADLRPEDRANSRRFAAWTIAAALSYALGMSALHRGWLPPGPPSVIMALLFNLPALGAVRSYRRLLREADELTRRIHMESLAYGFTAGVIFAMGWSLLEMAGAPDLDLAEGVVVSTVAWSLGQILTTRKYR
jgi:hypothetical protein